MHHAPYEWGKIQRPNAKRELNERFITQFHWHSSWMLASLQHVFCIFNWNPLNLCWGVCVCAFFRVSVISAHKLPEYGNEIGAKRARLTIKNEEKTYYFGCSLPLSMQPNYVHKDILLPHYFFPLTTFQDHWNGFYLSLSMKVFKNNASEWEKNGANFNIYSHTFQAIFSEYGKFLRVYATVFLASIAHGSIYVPWKIWIRY